MKHTRFIWFLLVGILAGACAKQADETPESEQYVTISASLDTSGATKTYLDGTAVKWEASDVIMLWYGDLSTAMDGEAYTLVSGEGTTSATFRGFAPVRAHYMGVYPESASVDCSKKGKLTVTLPTEQVATAGSFATGANVAVAYFDNSEYPEYSGDANLAFKNIGALMAVRLSDLGGHILKSVRLTGTADLSGTVEIKQNKLPQIDGMVSGNDFVELTGSFTAGNTYYFVVLPGSHTGFTLTFTDDKEQVATATSAYAYSIARNSNTLIADDIDLSAATWKTQEKVVLNEVQVNGDQFIELYNAGKSDEPLNGWQIFVNDADTPIWTGTTETLLPGGRTTVNCSGLATDKNTKLCLKNGSSEVKDVFIRGEIGEGWGTITLPEANALASFSRIPDGTGDWVCASPTKGSANAGKISSIDHGLILNELNGNDKFIELRNTSDKTINLEGVTVWKDGKKVWTGKSGQNVASSAEEGYVLLYSEDVVNWDEEKDAEKPKPAHYGYDSDLVFTSGLSPKKAVRVQLFNAAGVLIDDFNLVGYTKPCPASYGRNANGVWYYQEATPGTSGASNVDGVDPVTGLE